MRASERTGLLGEEKAAEYLAARGHHVLAQRWRSSAGELDLVTLDGPVLVGVEVKTRRGIDYGHPFEAVSDQKLRRLHRLLAEYAATHHHPGRARRVDAVSVLILPASRGQQTANIEHLRDI